VIETAVADIVGPAISAHEPDDLLAKNIGLLLESADFAVLGLEAKEHWLDLLGNGVGFLNVVVVGKELLEEGGKLWLEGVLLEERLNESLGNLAAGLDSVDDTVAKFSIVLKEGVGPCGPWPLALVV